MKSINTAEPSKGIVVVLSSALTFHKCVFVVSHAFRV